MNLTNFKNKRVLIMGLGLHGGGASAAAFFDRLGSQVLVTDLKTAQELTVSLKSLKRHQRIVYHLGGHRESDFRHTDYVLKNPGVRDDSKFLKIAKQSGARVLSDVEIFFLVCPAPIIGITGTKGKSTTTWLVGEFLRVNENIQNTKKIKNIEKIKRVWVAGNIRKSVLEILPRVRKGDWVVLELSSFQLDSLEHQRISPAIAVITNIFPDHLSRYTSMKTYAASKAIIFKFQQSDGFLFFNNGDGVVSRLARHAPGHVVRIRARQIFEKFEGAISTKPPTYQKANFALAIAVAKHVGVRDEAIRSVLKRFRGLSGRMEFVRTIRGVEFINDTTATNPEAGRAAIIATKQRIGVHAVHVIAGGSDKGLPIRDYVTALARNAASVIFLPGKGTEKMDVRFKNKNLRVPKLFHVNSMKQAVKIAYRNAKPGDVVLLSPGAASFGLFQNEFDRGGQFGKAVWALRS